MRIGSRLGRGTYLSLGPLGLLIMLPILIIYAALNVAVAVIMWTIIGTVRLVQLVVRASRAHRRAQVTGQ